MAPGFPRGGTLVRLCPAVSPLSLLLSWSHWVSLIHACSSLPQPSLKDFQPGLDQAGAHYGPVARPSIFPFLVKSWQASKSAGPTRRPSSPFGDHDASPVTGPPQPSLPVIRASGGDFLQIPLILTSKIQ